MDDNIEVGIADYRIASAPKVLIARGIGSCVVVCLYDKKKKIGAVAHVMLAHCADENLNPLRFVDTALPQVLGELTQSGVNIVDLEAHLIGGASMFADIEDYLQLGEENIDAAQGLLTDLSIPIKSKEVKGHVGRSVRFILETGEVQVTTK